MLKYRRAKNPHTILLFKPLKNDTMTLAQFPNETATRSEFVNSVAEVVSDYINDFYDFDKNPMLRVNPESKLVEVENGYAFQEDLGYSDEVIEEAAYAEGDATESATDNQAKQNFDYFPVTEFFNVKDGKGTLDMDAINRLADRYFKS